MARSRAVFAIGRVLACVGLCLHVVGLLCPFMDVCVVGTWSINKKNKKKNREKLTCVVSILRIPSRKEEKTKKKVCRKLRSDNWFWCVCLDICFCRFRAVFHLLLVQLSLFCVWVCVYVLVVPFQYSWPPTPLACIYYWFSVFISSFPDTEVMVGVCLQYPLLFGLLQVRTSRLESAHFVVRDISAAINSPFLNE